MEIFVGFILGYAFYVVEIILERICAKKAKYDCSKCRNGACCKKYCERKREKK